jgi:hypothetical protein
VSAFVINSYAFPAYDADALDYFSRAEALGGSFDQSGISATYSEAYVKTAISDMIVGLKADGVWSEIIELYLLTGVTFGGLMAKVKHAGTATLTNTSNNFVAADYIAAGSGAGLKGNGSNKSLTTVKTHGTLGSFGIYRTEKETTGTFFGESDGSAVNRFFFDGNGAGGAIRYYYGQNVGVNGNTDNGFLAVSRVSSTSLRAYRNTVVAGSNGSGITPTANTTTRFALFARILAPDSVQSLSNLRMSFAYVAQPLDDTQALNLSARVNTLMTALGCNVF